MKAFDLIFFHIFFLVVPRKRGGSVILACERTVRFLDLEVG